MNEIVYFACNDWLPSPKESKKLCIDYLTLDNVDSWLKENKVCINTYIIDMSCSYYITAPKSVIEQYFDELLPLVKEEPYDFMFNGDKDLFLEHKEENYGIIYYN